jgi:lysophospholipase L1-like esterase
VFLAVVNGLVLLLLLVAADRALGLLRRQPETSAGPRSIRLKEWPPLYDAWLVPPASALRDTDSLEARPYHMKIDRDGFIEPSRRYASPQLTIAFLGGSTTECLYVDESQRFPALVGVSLERALGTTVNVFNAGVSGSHTALLINSLYNKVLPLHPDVVVMMEAINDLVAHALLGGYWNDSATRSAIIDAPLPGARHGASEIAEAVAPNILGALRMARNRLSRETPAADEFASIRGTRRVIDRPRLLREYSANLRILIAIARAGNARPILMTAANRATAAPEGAVRATERLMADYQIPYSEFRDTLLAMNDAVRMVGAEEHVPVIDLAASVPPRAEFMYDVVHFNTKGSVLVAGLVADAIAPMVTHGKL